MNYSIIYFSGTGGTKLAAEKLNSEFEIKGLNSKVYNIADEDFNAEKVFGDMIIVMYPVHAFGAPIPVYDALLKLPSGNNKPVAVISISAGGEVTSNAGCRVKAIRILNNRNYNVIFEDMIMMPSNWSSLGSMEINNLIVNALDDKVKIIGKVLSNYKDNNASALTVKVPLASRVMAAIGTFSRKVGFPMMGRCFKADSGCDGCSICAAGCPQGNIKMLDDRPKFGHRCIVCMKCIYACPKNSISAGMFDSIRVKEGYDINKLVALARESKNNNDIVPPHIFKGHEAAKKYLEDIERNR